LAIGLSIYRDGTPETFDRALDFISRAATLAKRDGLSIVERSANRELAFTLMMAGMTGLQDIPGQKVESYLHRFEQIDGDTLLRDNDARPQQLIRLSKELEAHNQLNEAYFLADLAVQRDGSLDDAFLRRAKVLVGLDNYDRAMPDALEAYRLNTLRIRDVLKSPKDDFLEFFYTEFGGGGRIPKLEDITSERVAIFQTLSDIYSSKKMYTELLALSIEGDKFIAKSYFTPLIRAEAELGLGYDDLARQAAQEALKRATGTEQTDFIKGRLRSIFGERADMILPPTRTHRGWTVKSLRTSKRMGCNDGLANWRLRLTLGSC
jgi:tetratricopeptide (TPR) repeat protein